MPLHPEDPALVALLDTGTPLGVTSRVLGTPQAELQVGTTGGQVMKSFPSVAIEMVVVRFDKD
jgi:hypothetical protein